VIRGARGLIALAPWLLVCAACGSSTPLKRVTVSPSQAWLGLDYNSRPGAGGISDFVDHGIALDREGNIQPEAGALAAADSKLGRGLKTSLDAGMVPDIEVDPSADGASCGVGRGCLPAGSEAIDAYVSGFVATAQSVLASFPGRRVLFEPMDEPWNLSASASPGAQPGYAAAAEYARVLAQLLPAVATARDPAIPLDEVYVPATGQLADSSFWLSDLYRAEPCLRPGAGTCGPIEGWNVHAYGRPERRSEGIESVPGLRAGMASGADNIVVSEVGFCAADVGGGSGCAENTPDVVGTRQQTALWLTETLREALPMHRAGWLKALLVWARWSGGWSMQLPGGVLTPQGRALETFADAHATG
jgi:hypothetical protein